MSTDSNSFSLVRVALLGLALSAALLFLGRSATASAADEPFKIVFDQSSIQMGLIGDLPLDTVASGASLEGTIDEAGNVTVPKGNFKMPELGMDTPVKIRGFMGIESAATGTFDRTTGQLELDAKAGIWLSLDVVAALELAGMDLDDLIGGLGGGLAGVGSSLIKSQLRNLTCGFSPMDVHFTTESNSLASGTRFAEGPSGTGAITAEWSQLGPFSGRTKILGLIDPCQMILQYLPELLNGGLSGSLPEGIDLGDLDLAGSLANINDLDLGPSAIKLTRSTAEEPIDPVDPGPGPVDPLPKKAKLKLSVTPKKRGVKAGKTTVFKAKVKNTGTSNANQVRVCLTGPGVGVLVRWRCTKYGAIKAGTSKVRRIKVKVRNRSPRRAAGFKFRATAKNARASGSRARLRIRR